LFPNLFVLILYKQCINQMKKKGTIIIRIEEDLKNQIQQKANSIGLGLSSFIRITLIEKLKL